MKGNLLVRRFSAITAFVFMWIQGGVFALADSPRWEGKNERLQREAADARHLLSAKIQEVIDSGIYQGEAGRKLYLSQAEQGIKHALRELRAQVRKMSAAEILEQLAKIKKAAFQVGNERVLGTVSELETDDSLSLHEKMDALYQQINERQVLYFVQSQINSIGNGDVNKMLAGLKDQWNKRDRYDSSISLFSVLFSVKYMVLLFPLLPILYIGIQIGGVRGLYVAYPFLFITIPIWVPICGAVSGQWDPRFWKDFGSIEEISEELREIREVSIRELSK